MNTQTNPLSGYQTNRTSGYHEKGEGYDTDLSYALGFVRSEAFMPDTDKTECESLLTIRHIQDALRDAASEYHDYALACADSVRWQERATNKDGLVDHNLIPKDVRTRESVLTLAFDRRVMECEQHIEAEVVLIIRDALGMLGITDWETVLELSRAAICGGVPGVALPRLYLPGEAAEKDSGEKETAEKETAAPSRAAPVPLEDLRQTAGWHYAEKYLSGMDSGIREWIALNLKSGHLVTCENCHTVRLAEFPFAWDRVLVDRYGDPGPSACDVCYHIPHMAEFPYMTDNLSTTLKHAHKDLRKAREHRAELLYSLWMSSSDTAYDLLWSEMRKGVNKAIRYAGNEHTANEQEGKEAGG